VTRRVSVDVVQAAVMFAFALGIRLGQHHDALLYPDGYQYLLMARGVSEHLQLTTALGPHGDTFVPNADAAVKPLFPIVVSTIHAVGVSWLDAARLATAAASATAVVALSLLVSKLGGSRLAGIAAGFLLLASPSVAFWSGFSGPDPMAVAFTLTAALAFVHRRSRLGGILTGLAIATRPEVIVIAAAAAVIGIRRPETRGDVRHAAPAAILTTALVFALVRAPIPIHDWRLVRLFLVLLGAAVVAAIVPLGAHRYVAIAALGGVGFVLLTRSGPHELWSSDWPLVLSGVAGAIVLLREWRGATVVAVALSAVVLLGSVYLVKNPSLARYFTLLLPAAAVLAGVGLASLPRHLRAAGLAALVVVIGAGFDHQVPGSRNYDVFEAVARSVAPKLRGEPLVTAAPDAYGFWLPMNSVLQLRTGARGAVLLDASQRMYDPTLTAHGRVIDRVSDGIAFARANGQIDAGPAVLIAGRVVAVDGSPPVRASRPTRSA
jgi:hypothetical protein